MLSFKLAAQRNLQCGPLAYSPGVAGTEAGEDKPVAGTEAGEGKP